jgi:hypothetical protein
VTQPKKKLQACDFLNWDALCKLAAYVEPEQVKSRKDVIGMFAYTITQTGDEAKRDTILAEQLTNSTYGSRPESNEAFLKMLAQEIQCDLGELRKFAKQCGVHLKAKWWG